MEEAIASNKPAAVESAAAKPPATTNAMTQFGRFAISGFANTIMSRSTLTISLPFQPNDSAFAAKSLFLSL